MGHGDFRLYKNSERYFEVQTRQWTCNGGVTCNCGVVLRDHNDVIEFNCCNDLMKRDEKTPIRVKIRSNKCLSPGISIKKSQPGVTSAKYQVMFPSGAKVEIQRSYWGLNIYLYTPRAKVPSNESGLCIYPPKGQDANTYGESLRLSSNESYFDVLPPPVSAYAVEYSEACECKPNAQHGECNNAFNIAFPTLTGQKTSPMFLCDRDKRDIHFSDEPTDEDFNLFKRALPSRKRHKREAGRISKENATYHCEERISKTKIGKLCEKIGIDVQALVNACSFDVETTADFSYALGGVDSLMDQCENVAALNLSRAANSSADGAVESSASSLVEEIKESLCSNDCSSNGRCVNGSCICNKDFTANDCSAYIFEIPTILSLQGSGLCDRRTRPCRKVTVLGTGFIPSENMTCHVEEFKVVNSTWSPNKTELKFPGVMTDLVLADCNLPESPVSPGYFHEINAGTPAAGLKISVSNDGEHRSKETLTLISYDSACMSCNISSGCSLKANSCFINGYCFAENESNPIDWCYQCIPGVNASSWTKRQVNLPPKFSPATQYYALYQENLELPIKVLDPEGMPITVTLMDGSSGQAIIRENVLFWNVSNSSNTRFTLKATDTCQAVSMHTITISLVVCPCQNNGNCIPDPQSPRGSGLYQCRCAPGFAGDACQTNIDECQSYPCARGRCIDGLNNFSCICYPGYVGRTCDTDYDDCSSSPCVHGNCIDYTGSYGCTCNPGYAGENCTIDIDECASSPCRHGTCIDQVNSYICQCDAGYTGYDCKVEIDECQSSPCVRGICRDQLNGFTCNCEAGFSGMRCEENIDDCKSSPCVNGTCTDLVNNYTCSCNVGFTGRDCDIVVTACTADSCFPNVTCSNNSHTIACGPCPLDFTGDGKNCREIDDCVNHTCTNGASCKDGINSYTCNCSVGFTGEYCETDIDDCVNHACANVASCVDGIDSYSCNCAVGFTGLHCETDIDDCVNHTCINSGSCVDGVNSYLCSCVKGYTGDRCEKEVPITSPTPSPPAESSSKKVSSKATTESTTEAGADDIRKTVFSLEIRVQQDWDDSLKDKNSQKFKDLADLMSKQIWVVYSGSSELEKVEIISMRPGSIITEFKLTFKTQVTTGDALAPLRRVMATGNLGSLHVDRNSLMELKTVKTVPPTEDNPGPLNPTNIGLICGSVVTVVIAVVTIIGYYCYKTSTRRQTHTELGDAMPADETCSRREKYEMAEVPSKGENAICFEEKGICNQGME
ncbi:neurogenic locus notch homolog protein 1-like [Acropora muricata]|uniref:neurogenic locus notch homolog protein 1-like n=1 Tax=Acropora muricata TaxID=159855 RepID=UPI0034E4F6A5